MEITNTLKRFGRSLDANDGRLSRSVSQGGCSDTRRRFSELQKGLHEKLLA